MGRPRLPSSTRLERRFYTYKTTRIWVSCRTCPPITPRHFTLTRMEYYLRGPNSTLAMGALLWALVGSWDLHIAGWPERLDSWSSADWRGTMQYYSALGYDTTNLVYAGSQIQGWRQAALLQSQVPHSASSIGVQSSWTDVAIVKYGAMLVGRCLRVDIQLNRLPVYPQFLRHEVARR